MMDTPHPTEAATRPDVPPACDRLSALLARLESELARRLPPSEAEPSALHAAMRHAVLGGGKRMRPRLTLAVACSCGADADQIDLALRAACAVELVHAASLVHDDLPCFDDASERRGQPTVHARFGEPLALLTGDALLALAFEVLSEGPPRLAQAALRMVRVLAAAVGSRDGVIGGQAHEAAHPDPRAMSPELLARYHEMKTAALFRCAAQLGALAAEAADVRGWAELGRLIGLGYQAADDLIDVRGSALAAGKPVGQDLAHGRPNLVLQLGEAAATERLHTLLRHAEQQAAAVAAEPRIIGALLGDLRRQLQPLLGAGTAGTRATPPASVCQPPRPRARRSPSRRRRAAPGMPVAV